MKPSERDVSAQERWLELLSAALHEGTFVRVKLGKHRGAGRTLGRIAVRRVELRAGRRFSFVFHHRDRDITKNFEEAPALKQIAEMLGNEFLSATLVTTTQIAQLEFRDGAAPKLTVQLGKSRSPADLAHDRSKARWISAADSPWLHLLGVTTRQGAILKGMEAKFRQINRFVDVFKPLVESLPCNGAKPLTVVDMGCGKGYLTFAVYEFLRRRNRREFSVRGIEARADLVELCNRIAREAACDQIRFEQGTIADTAIERADVLIALHACDTATDDAIAKGIDAGASLILVAPCCHKEVRPQLRPPAVLAPALKHGILLEREAEFATDALRAALLEWAGYGTKVFEFISPEHTSKNLMIAATRRTSRLNRDRLTHGVAALAAFYGIRHQRLAQHLEFNLETEALPQRANEN
jgi:SAM-dependent methyltransferase